MIRVLGGLLTRPVAGRGVLTRAGLDVPLRDGKAAAMTGPGSGQPRTASSVLPAEGKAT